MDTAPRPSGRPGTPGLDVFKIAGQSISGFLPSFKTGNPRAVRQPFTSQLEERLALYLEYHPHVRTYQRGDASTAFAEAHRLETPLGTPYRITYSFDGTVHDYLPDFVGTLCDGGLLIAEAGQDREKRKDKALAKADAALRLATLHHGAYWIGTELLLSPRRHYNLLFLHSRRQPFPTYAEIAAHLTTHWLRGEPATVIQLVKQFGSRWSDAEVEAAVWKLVGDAAAAGYLLVDLTEVVVDRSTPLVLLAPSAAPILPDPLPTTLSALPEASDEPPDTELLSDDELLMQAPPLPGPTFDPSVLESDSTRAQFARNLTAVTDVLAGMGLRTAAERHDLAPSTLSRLVQRAKQFGQKACLPYGTYRRDRALRPEFQELLRKLYVTPLRPTMTAVYEDVRLKQLAEALSAQEGTLVCLPTYRQVWSYLTAIAHEASVSAARAGLKHPPRERLSPASFVLSITAPALICQVDEHTVDLLVVAPDGTVMSQQAHAAVLICVKTAAIVGAVLALDHLKEEDYMRLIKQSLEPKEHLTTLYACTHPWPCFGKPSVVFHDRGKIFTSERATQVLVDRLGIVTEQAPPYAPSAKGTVEALFTWVTRKLTHRLPGTTKGAPEARGLYDSAREAARAGITFDVLEQLFIQAIVDGYMREWDKLRRQTRIALWEAGVRTHGVPRWMGSADDLKLLLMKAVNRKNPLTGRYALHPQRGLSFLGRRYVSPGLLDRLRGKEIDIYYDRRDLSVIYLFLEGELVGEAYCTEWMGRRVSIWEANAMRTADGRAAQAAAAESLAGRQQIQETASAGRQRLARETERLEAKRRLDLQRPEVHPAHVQRVLEALQAQPRPPVTPAPAPAPPHLLPRAEPDGDLGDESGVCLPIRSREEQA